MNFPPIKIQATTTFFPTEVIAEVAAAQNRADDTEWTYTVAQASSRQDYVVQIHDEDGIFVGNL